MSEFSNRIDAQRKILGVVNERAWKGGALCGLSGGAIDRWVASNALSQEAPLVEIVRAAAAQLFFLANKSQEQVSEEYQSRSEALADIVASLPGLVGSAGQ